MLVEGHVHLPAGEGSRRGRRTLEFLKDNGFTAFGLGKGRTKTPAEQRDEETKDSLRGNLGLLTTRVFSWTSLVDDRMRWWRAILVVAFPRGYLQYLCSRKTSTQNTMNTSRLR
jgi:hypothetical protein